MPLKFLENIKSPGFLKPLTGEYLFKKEPEDVKFGEAFKSGVESIKSPSFLKPVTGEFLFREEPTQSVVLNKSPGLLRPILEKVEDVFSREISLPAQVPDNELTRFAKTEGSRINEIITQKEEELSKIPNVGIVIPKYNPLKIFEPWIGEQPAQQRVELIKEIENYKTASKLYDEVLYNSEDEGFVRDFQSGVMDALSDPAKLIPFYGNIETTDELMGVLTAVKKVEEKEPLTNIEKSLIEKYRAMGLPIDRGMGYWVGRMTTEMPTFIAEFAMLSPVYEAVGEAVGKKITQQVGEELAKKTIVKIGTKTAQAIIGGAAQGLTNLPLIAKGTAERMLPHYGLTADKNGLIEWTEEVGDTFPVALGKSLGTTVLEYVTERAGVLIEEPLKYLRTAVFGKFLAKMGLSKFDEIMSTVSRVGGWNGIIGEVFEEELNELLQAPIDRRPYYNPLTAVGMERLLTETLGIAIFSGIVNVTAYTASKITKNTQRQVVNPQQQATQAGIKSFQDNVAAQINFYVEGSGDTVKGIDLTQATSVDHAANILLQALPANLKQRTDVKNSVNNWRVSGQQVVDYVSEPKYKMAEEGLTTKILQTLRGKTTVNKQFIDDLTRAEGIKKPEIEIVKEVLEEYPAGEKVPVDEFVEKVKSKLLPLDKVPEEQRTYRNITLPSERNEAGATDYEEIIYESPISNEAADIHWRAEVYPNYFAHVRDDRVGAVRRILEIQSDLFQRGRLEKERQVFPGRPAYGDTKVTKRLAELDLLNPYRNTWWQRIAREEIRRAAYDGMTALRFPTGETAMRIEGLGEQTFGVWVDSSKVKLGESIADTVRRAKLSPQDLKTGMSVNRSQAGIGDKWIIAEVLGDGKFKAVPENQFTSYQIEGIRGKEALSEPIKKRIESFSETFDISGLLDTSNPIYVFYESTLAKYLKRIRPNLRIITDAANTTWREITITEADRADVLAFKEVDELFKPEYNIPEAEMNRRLRKLFTEDEVKFMAKKRLVTNKGKAVLGMYYQAMIEVVKQNGKVSDFVSYHEAFHAYLALFVSRSERLEVLRHFQLKWNQYLEDNPELGGKAVYTTKQTEEVMADAFAEYLTKKRTFSQKIKLFFIKILNKIKSWIGKEDKMIAIFEDILVGKRPAVPVEARGPPRFKQKGLFGEPEKPKSRLEEIKEELVGKVPGTPEFEALVTEARELREKAPVEPEEKPEIKEKQRALFAGEEPELPETYSLEKILEGKKLITPKKLIETGTIRNAGDRWADVYDAAEKMINKIEEEKIAPLEEELEGLKGQRDKISNLNKRILRQRIEGWKESIGQIEGLKMEDAADFGIAFDEEVRKIAEAKGLKFEDEENWGDFLADVSMSIFGERERTPFWDMTVRETIDTITDEWLGQPPEKEKIRPKELEQKTPEQIAEKRETKKKREKEYKKEDVPEAGETDEEMIERIMKEDKLEEPTPVPTSEGTVIIPGEVEGVEKTEEPTGELAKVKKDIEDEAYRQLMESEVGMASYDWGDEIDDIIAGKSKMRLQKFDRADWMSTLGEDSAAYMRLFKDDPNLDPPDVVADNLGMSLADFKEAIASRIRRREFARIKSGEAGARIRRGRRRVIREGAISKAAAKMLIQQEAFIQKKEQFEKDKKNLSREPKTFRAKYRDIMPEAEFFNYEWAYAEKRISKHRGYTARLVKRLEEVGVRREVLDQLKVEGQLFKNLVKIKREVTGEVSAVVSKSALNYFRNNIKVTKPDAKWIKKFSFEKVARDVGNIVQGYETGARFFRRIGEGYKRLIFDPVRTGERRAAELDYRLRNENLKTVFKLKKKQAQDLFRFAANKQGRKVKAKSWAELDSVVRKAYIEIRRTATELFPQVKEVTIKRGREIGEVKNYSPLYTRDDIALIDQGGVFDFVRKDPYFASIKERLPEVPVEMYESDYRKTMDRWITGVSRYIELGNRTVPVKYFIDSKEFKGVAGKAITQKVHEWYRNVVNPPKTEGLWQGLRFLRKLQATSILALKYTVTVKQFLNLIDFSVVTNFRQLARATTQVLTNSPLAKMAKNAGSIRERTLGLAIQDLRGTITQFLRRPPEFADRLTAQLGHVAIMDQQMARLKKEGTPLTAKRFEQMQKRADDIVDAVMGAMSRAEMPRYFRTELGKNVNMFYSQLNSKMQFYVSDIFAHQYPELNKLSGSHKKLIAKAIVALIIGGYLETVINKLSFTDDPDEIAKDTLKSIISNFPLLGPIVFSLTTGQPYVPMPILGNVIQLMENIARGNTGDAIWDLTGFLGLPTQLKKTYEGLVAAIEGRVTDKKGRTRFRIEGPMEKIRTILKGKWGSKAARDYFRGKEEPDNIDDLYDKMFQAETKGRSVDELYEKMFK